jgi:hypothetical protein
MLNQNPKSRYDIHDIIRLLKNAKLCSNKTQKYVWINTAIISDGKY